ncbi:MAG TPA: nitroreductase family deazaflavin-dependent oxidoreductase [Marmoricola sp.]|nr:nitroreductase family deazaflavin-dependent oxidoreductase [Marmoricola sp.]HNI70063.1 nitroreductase family deazaflavin-dependent oxidoreductase [Marmoricola sp.]
MANSPQRQRPGFLETETFHKVMKRLSAAHVLLYRRSKGRIGATMPVTATQWLPVCLLTHTGRRSGLRRVTPLLNLADGERVVLFAAQGGLDQNPQWYRNLVANPDCRIQTRGLERPMHAHTASNQERQDLWPRMKRHYPGWATYQSWTTREIPIVICVP